MHKTQYMLCPAGKKSMAEEFLEAACDRQKIDYYTETETFTDKVKILEALEAIQDGQQGELRFYLDQFNFEYRQRFRLADDAPVSLEDLFTRFKNNEFKPYYDGTLWLLYRFADMMSGEFSFDSGFYDVENWTALCNQSLIERVKESELGEYILVAYDTHF